MTLVSSHEEAKQVREAIPDKPLLWSNAFSKIEESDPERVLRGSLMG
jgi:hypothetical protein